MALITVNGYRIGQTRCDYCQGQVTLEQLSVDTAGTGPRINGDSAWGYQVYHVKCLESMEDSIGRF
jgi:hypothetical protein